MPSDAFAEATADLGEPLATFATSRLQAALYLTFGLLALLAGLGLLLLAVFILFADAQPNQAVPVGKAAAGGCLLVSGAVAMFARYRTMRGARVVAFERGLVRSGQGAYEVMPWDEVKEVRRGLPPGAREFSVTAPARLALTDLDGLEWVFTESLSGLNALREIAEERTLPHLRAAAVRAVKEDSTLAFFAVGLDRRGLTFPGRPPLEWPMVASAEVKKGHVVVSSALVAKPYLRVPLYEVPNAHLLLALIEHFQRR